MEIKKNLLRVFGFAGLVVFLPLFLFTFSDPQLIEKSAESFVAWKLNEDVDEKIDSLKIPKPSKFEKLLSSKAVEIRQDTDIKLQTIKEQLKADVPKLMAEEMARLKNLDCECRKAWENRIRMSMQLDMLSLEIAKAKLIDFTHMRYMEIVQNLTLDVRVFLGANVAVFLMLLVTSLLRPWAVEHLFLPGGLLLISTSVCSYFYLFEQNWFYTILYNDYTGYGYVVYLLLVFAVLSDIVFNKGKVTTRIINFCLDVLGQAATLAPCS